MSNDKTKWIFDDEDGFDGNDKGGSVEFTETIEKTVADTDGPAGSDEATRVVQNVGAEKTTISRGEVFTSGDEQIDPVVGWLVVIKGPGLGQAVSLGAGMNSVGRGASERVTLGFGDTSISTSDHARIIYDDDSRKFFIAHGSGKNITKVDGQMVANTLPLENGATVEITKSTHLRFVAFCSESFDWADVAGDGDA
ncbi:MAG: FHA domain-containing protein [Pseudomonadota bacterium]